MKQKQLVLEYIKENGFIIPAKMSGKIYKNTMFGSEVSRVCRSLRAEGKIQSTREGKFEKFFIQFYREQPIVPFAPHVRFEGSVVVKCSCNLGTNH